MQNYILPILIFSPIIFSIILMSPILSSEEKVIRRSTKIFSIIHFIFTTFLLITFDYTNMGNHLESNLKIFNSDWVETIGLNASFSVDALSILLVGLTSIIFLITVFLSKKMIKHSYKLYYSLILIIETAVLGILCAKDMFLFFLFWELELIPMYIILLKWGSGNKIKIAEKFIIYTFLGSIFILLGILLLYILNFINTGTLNADFYNIDISNIDNKIKYIIFLFFLIGFGVKLPIIPLHSWLADVHSQAETPVSIILSSILLKVGAYGILRFNMQVLNDTFIIFAPLIMILGVVNIIYGSICAINQKDIKRIIAYSSISAMGIFLLGAASLTETGITGAIFQLISHAFISAGLFTIAGIIYIKCGTKNILKIKGLGEKMPVLMFLSIPIILSAMGVPLLSGFIAEFLCFIGAFTSQIESIIDVKISTLIALLSLIFSCIYILKIYHSTFFGELNKKYNQVKDINIHQKIILIVIIIFILYLGIFPTYTTNILSEYSIINFNIIGGF